MDLPEERQPLMEPPPKYTDTPSQPPPPYPPSQQPSQQPYPPSQQPYPPSQQPYPPSQQPYPPSQQPYPPAQQPYPRQPAHSSTQQATVTTVVQQPTHVHRVAFGNYPVQATCPRGHTVMTVVRHEPGTTTWMIALVLCILLGPLCALIPFCVDDMQDVVHTCPIDGTVIYRKDGSC